MPAKNWTVAPSLVPLKKSPIRPGVKLLPVASKPAEAKLRLVASARALASPAAESARASAKDWPGVAAGSESAGAAGAGASEGVGAGGTAEPA